MIFDFRKKPVPTDDDVEFDEFIEDEFDYLDEREQMNSDEEDDR